MKKRMFNAWNMIKIKLNRCKNKQKIRKMIRIMLDLY